MAYSLIITCLALFSLISNLCHSFNPKLLNVSKYDQYSSYWETTDAPSSYGEAGWGNTDATWYGGPYDAGSTGGSCGYEAAVESAPFSSKITAAAASIYSNGAACGTCYQVKCTSSPYCSGQPVTVVVTDSCLGCDHLFDLSGISFGAMANPGEDEQLRNLGRLPIQYQSVECEFSETSVAFRIDPGSNANYFATAIEYEDGDGLSAVAIREANTNGDWVPMQLSWGAVYEVSFTNGYTAPFSIMLTDAASKTVVAKNVIPANYVAQQTYRSVVNFGA